MSRIQLFVILMNILLLLTIIRLIVKRTLKEKYALLWIGATIVLFPFSFSRFLLDKVSNFFGIVYPPSFLFFIASFFILLITLHFSIVLSKYSEDIKELTQKIALLEQRIEQK